MADLQDTNAATEEIYGPLLIVECPVTHEMISQSAGGAAASAGRNAHTPTPFGSVLGPQCVKEEGSKGFRCETRQNSRLTDLKSQSGAQEVKRNGSSHI